MVGDNEHLESIQSQIVQIQAEVVMCWDWEKVGAGHRRFGHCGMLRGPLDKVLSQTKELGMISMIAYKGQKQEINSVKILFNITKQYCLNIYNFHPQLLYQINLTFQKEFLKRPWGGRRQNEIRNLLLLLLFLENHKSKQVPSKSAVSTFQQE